MNKISVQKTVIGIALSAASILYLTGCSGKGGDGTVDTTCSAPIEASLSDGAVRIGGATTTVELLTLNSTDWTLYNNANELHITSVDMPTKETGVEVEGYIHDIKTVDYQGKHYAMLAMGQEGITAVEIAANGTLTPRSDLTVQVNYNQDNITWTEGSGNVVTGNSISSSRAPISSLAVYNEGNATNPSWQLIIADEGYGLHKTALANFFEHNLDSNDGTLLIDGAEKYTLQYAGENPWGGPKSLTLVGEGNTSKLFVAQGFMGMGIYNPQTFDQIGRYNHYIDNNVKEDWFMDLNVSAAASTDSCTGMPDYNQAAYEITTSKIDSTIDTPWADFESLGKYYYDARKVDVATFGTKTIAYIAYGMAGVVAVDVSGYETGNARGGADCSVSNNFREGKYLGYVPAIPAHGPEERVIGGSDSVFSRAGAGMLKDAGIVDVKVDTGSNKVFYTDHFGGLMVVDHANTPDVDWHGPNGKDGYDNDPNKSVEHHPAYEFVTSYDMNVSSTVDEALPNYTNQTPIALVTGEVGGHGNALALTGNGFDASDSAPADVVMAAGAGGLNFIEVYGTTPTYDYNVTAQLATTNEIGADAEGNATVAINVGHAAGVGTYENMLYLADGPHGMSVWEVADGSCNNIPVEDVKLVGNTLQSESAVEVNGTMMYPTPHADDVIVVNDGVNKSALVSSLSSGLRRVNVNEMGTADAPKLLYPTSEDIYEHSVEETKVGGISLEDRVYSVAVSGNYAFTADGLNGVTVYDLSKTPGLDNSSGFVVDNIKGTGDDRINNATGIALWGNYAFVAGGATGITVIDISDPSNLSILRTFQPIKWEDANAHNADGVAISVKVVGDYAFFTYDSFGVLAYNISDLTNPEDHPGTEMGRDGRYDAAGYFKLQDSTTYTNNLVAGTDFKDWSGGASGIDAIQVGGKTYIYVAYGDAGAVKIDWSDVASPMLEEHANTSGSANDIVIWNGRAYVADGGGGLVLFR